MIQNIQEGEKMSRKKVSFVLENTTKETKTKTATTNSKEEQLKKFEKIEKAIKQKEAEKQDKENFHIREFGEKEQGGYLSFYCTERLRARLDNAVERIKQELPNNPEMQKTFQAKRGFSKSIFIKKGIIELLEKFNM